MRWALTIAAVLFGIPLLTLGWLYATDSKFIVVRNPGSIAKEISVIAYSGSYIERRDPVTVAGGGFTWMFFSPRVKGGVTVVCKQSDGFSTFPLGTETHAAPAMSDVTVDNCDHHGVYKRSAS
ncbi:MAG TPA: hypothetical protein VMF58_16770 [Rhizomicrobium sp.]|nr:hypothetical protein [Rhizomicrobium sp.]